MKIGVIADDFTGASDIALTLAEGGMSVAQFVGVPKGRVDGRLDAGVVALKTRTIAAKEAIAQSAQACDWLLDQGAVQIIFKVCSTFDSTQDGNIGPVLDALMAKLPRAPVLVCPAFPENGRSVYQGHLFVQDKLLNESGMQDHPLTPMKDADLRRVLGAQSTHEIGHVAASVVMQGKDAIRAAMPKAGPVIIDAIRDADLHHIGAAAKGYTLLCGGSGIALGLPGNFGIHSRAPSWKPVAGPAVVLSGSCSSATRAQVATFSATHPSFEITAEAVIHGSVSAATLCSWVTSHDAPTLIYSSADPDVVEAAQEKFGREASAQAIEGLFAEVAAALVAQGVRRLSVAGGETSGAVVKGLGARTLHIGPRIAAGVPMLRVDDTDVALALKSGNFGGPDFFRQSIDRMKTPG